MFHNKALFPFGKNKFKRSLVVITRKKSETYEATEAFVFVKTQEFTAQVIRGK